MSPPDAILIWQPTAECGFEISLPPREPSIWNLIVEHGTCPVFIARYCSAGFAIVCIISWTEMREFQRSTFGKS